MELVRPRTAVITMAAERSVITEDEFLRLYERTARPIRAYLYRMLNDISRTDDILQETYLRFLQARLPAGMTEEHRGNYLFRIATNLLREEGGARKAVTLVDCPCNSDVAEDVREQNDCAWYLQQLTARQRKLLWLAYVEGFTHKEIAEIIGVKAPSIRPMLARARGRLTAILKKVGRTSR
jgi:RNA polymerase sigma-70 factor (ECF subfamily)